MALTEETGAGWFASLFGYNTSRDASIPNYVSNGVDVPMNQPATVSLWNKYGLNLGTAFSAPSDPTPNTAPAADQTWYSRAWQGVKNTTKFVFCPIFTECPDPLPPGGVKLQDLTGAAGKAVGDTLMTALGPIMPLLLMALAVLILVNLTLSRAGVRP